VAIEFAGFTADHRITGRLPLADDRLSDMLNSVARVVIRGAVSENIDSGIRQDGDVMIACGDLWLVAASGRRGIETQRRRTSTLRIQAGLGRFVVEGDLHVPQQPGRAGAATPKRSLDDLLAGRDLLVPVTSATLTFDRAGRSLQETHETLLVNRSRIDWIEGVGVDEDESVELQDDPWASELIGTEPAGSHAPATGGRSWGRQLRSIVGR
jgi:hypothetical protein